MKKVPCEVFVRTVGYYSPVSRMNKGKVEEHMNVRTFFEI